MTAAGSMDMLTFCVALLAAWLTVDGAQQRQHGHCKPQGKRIVLPLVITAGSTDMLTFCVALPAVWLTVDSAEQRQHGHGKPHSKRGGCRWHQSPRLAQQTYPPSVSLCWPPD